MKQLIPLLGLAVLAGLSHNASAQIVTSQSKFLDKSRPEAPNLAAVAAADYRQKARFPEWSEPIPDGYGDPLQVKRQPTEQSLPQNDDWVMSVRASGISFESGQTVTLYASVKSRTDQDDDFPLVGLYGPPPKDWDISGMVAKLDGSELGRVSYRDDGVAPDQKAGDGVYTASFTLPEAYQPKIGTAENLAIFVTANSASGDELKALGGVLYSHPAGHLTGRYRDSIVDGDLVIQAEVEIEAAARFQLAGTIDSEKGRALASARMAEKLEVGTHWLDLRFYGLALSERGASGPLTLGSVTLTTANGIPNALGPLMENTHRTQSYRANSFHTREFGRADLMEAARRLERDAARHGSRD